MADCLESCANPCSACPLAPKADAVGVVAAGADDASSLLREAVNACVRQSARDAAQQLGFGVDDVDVAVAPDLDNRPPAFVYRISIPISADDARWTAFDTLVRKHRLLAEEASCLVSLRGELAQRA